MKSSKKVFAGFLAAAMATTFIIPAYAAPVTGDQGGAIGGEVAVPVIDMDLPTFTNGSVIFDTFNQLGNGQQVISSEFEFVNNSTVPVKINLKGYTAATDSSSPILPISDPALVEDAGGARNMLLWINEAKKTDDKLNYELVDGKKVYPAYDKTTDADKAFSAFQKSGDTAAVTNPANPVKYSRMARGSEAKVKADGTIEAIALDPATILYSRNKTTLRFDGSMNKQAAWGTGEKITITPVFTIEPQTFDPSGVDVEPAAPSAATLTFTAPSAASLGLVAGGPIVVTADQELKATLDAADYEIVIKSADGNTTRVVNGAATATVSQSSGGTFKDTVTIKQRYTGVVAGDKITVTLKKSAFKTPTAALDTATTTETLA